MLLIMFLLLLNVKQIHTGSVSESDQRKESEPECEKGELTPDTPGEPIANSEKDASVSPLTRA